MSQASADPISVARTRLLSLLSHLSKSQFEAGLRLMRLVDLGPLCTSAGLRAPKAKQIGPTSNMLRSKLHRMGVDQRARYLYTIAQAVTLTLASDHGRDSEALVAAGESEDAGVWDQIAGLLVAANPEFAHALDHAAHSLDIPDRQQDNVEGSTNAASPAAEETSPESNEDTGDVGSDDDVLDRDSDAWEPLFGEFPILIQVLIDWLLSSAPYAVAPSEVLRSLDADTEAVELLSGITDALAGDHDRHGSPWYIYGWTACGALTDTLTVDALTPFPAPQIVKAAQLADCALAQAMVAHLWIHGDHDAAAQVIRSLTPTSPSRIDVLAFLMSMSADQDNVDRPRILRLAREAIDSFLAADDDAVVLRQLRNQVLIGQAGVLREQRRLSEAQEPLNDVDQSQLSPHHLAAFVSEQMLIITGVAFLTDLPFPAGSDRDVNGFERFRPHRDLLDQIRRDAGDDASLLWLISVIDGALAEIDGNDADAAEHYLTAIELSGPGSPVTARMLFQRSTCRLRTLRPEAIEPAWGELEAALMSGFKPSAAQWTATFDLLELIDSDHRFAWLAFAVESQLAWQGFVPALAQDAAGGSETARQSAAHLATNERIPPEARFDLLHAALKGAASYGTAEEIETIVDHVEDLLVMSASRDLDQRWGSTLSGDDHLRSIIGPVAADLTGVHLLQRSGRIDEAVDLAERVFWRVQTGGHYGYSPDDLVALLAELGAPDTVIARLNDAVAVDEDVDEPAPIERPVHITFVGGNEKQASYLPAIEKRLADTYAGLVTVTWENPGWNTNWMPSAERVEALYPTTDALVIMTFVRTNCGRRLRRTSGEAGVPWVSCTGHGRDSIIGSIDRAVSVARGSQAQ